VLTVNYIPEEKHLVPQFLQNHRYTFPVLQVPSSNWMQEMKIVGTNYLVDRDGRVVFKPAPKSKEDLETVETEVEMLLSQPAWK
jgi:glutathione peroxidase-family protein